MPKQRFLLFYIFLVGISFSYLHAENFDIKAYTVASLDYNDEPKYYGLQITPEIVLFEIDHDHAFESFKTYNLAHMSDSKKLKGEGRLLIRLPKTNYWLIHSRDFKNSTKILQFYDSEEKDKKKVLKGDTIRLLNMNQFRSNKYGNTKNQASHLAKYEGNYISDQNKQDLFALSTKDLKSSGPHQYHDGHWAAVSENGQLLGLIERKEFKYRTPFTDSFKQTFYLYRKIKTTTLYKALQDPGLKAKIKKIYSRINLSFKKDFKYQFSDDKKKVQLIGDNKVLTIDTENMIHYTSNYGNDYYRPNLLYINEDHAAFTTSESEIYKVSLNKENILNGEKFDIDMIFSKKIVSNDHKTAAIWDDKLKELDIINMDTLESIFSLKNNGARIVLWIEKIQRFALIDYHKIRFVSQDGILDENKTVTLPKYFRSLEHCRVYEALDAILIEDTLISYETGNELGKLQSKIYVSNDSSNPLIEIVHHKKDTHFYEISPINLQRKSILTFKGETIAKVYDFRDAAHPFFIITHHHKKGMTLLPITEKLKFQRLDSYSDNLPSRIKKSYILKRPPTQITFSYDQDWSFKMKLSEDARGARFNLVHAPKGFKLHKDGSITFKCKNKMTLGGPCKINLTKGDETLATVEFKLQAKTQFIPLREREGIADVFYYPELQRAVAVTGNMNRIYLFNYPAFDEKATQLGMSQRADVYLKYKQKLLIFYFSKGYIVPMDIDQKAGKQIIKMPGDIIRHAKIGPNGKIWMIKDRKQSDGSYHRILSISEIDNDELREKAYTILVPKGESKSKAIQQSGFQLVYTKYNKVTSGQAMKGSSITRRERSSSFAPLSPSSFSLNQTIYKVTRKLAYPEVSFQQGTLHLDQKNKKLHVYRNQQRAMLSYPKLRFENVTKDELSFRESQIKTLNRNYLLQYNKELAVLISRRTGEVEHILKPDTDIHSIRFHQDCFSYIQQNSIYMGAIATQ